MESNSDSSESSSNSEPNDFSASSRIHSDQEEFVSSFSLGSAQRNKRKRSKKQQMLGIFASSSEAEDVSHDNFRDIAFVQEKPSFATQADIHDDLPTFSNIDSIDAFKPFLNSGSQQLDSEQSLEHNYSEKKAFSSFNQPKKNISSRIEKPTAQPPSNISNVALKMMQKMGYKQGKGLGRDESGIVDPIQAVSTQGKKGIAYGHKKNLNSSSILQKKRDKSNDTASDKQYSSLSSTSGLNARRNKLIQNNIDIDAILNKVETAINKFEETQNLKSDVSISDNNIQVPSFSVTDNNVESLAKLKNEIKLGLDLAVNKSHALKTDISLENTKIAQFASQISSVNDSMESTQKELSHIQNLISDIQLCQSLSLTVKNKLESPSFEISNINLQFEEFLTLQKKLQQVKLDTLKLNSKDTCIWFDWRLHEWVTGILFIIAKPIIVNWDVQSKSVDLITLLFKPYLQLISDSSIFLLNQPDSTVQDHQRQKTFIIQEWDVYYPDHALNIFETWTLPYIPQQVIDHLINSVVVSKIIKALDQCEISSFFEMHNSFKAPHYWIHPWLPYISEPVLKNQIIPALSIKLGSLVNFWYTSLKNSNFSDDKSSDIIRAAIVCWKDVFDAKSYIKLQKTYINPNLRKLISKPNLIINARSQSPISLQAFSEFTRWYDVIMTSDWVEVFETTFVPNWLDYLRIWLSNINLSKTNSVDDYSKSKSVAMLSNNNLSWVQISEWYLAWKSLIPAKIVDNNKVQNILRRALWLIQDRMDYLRDRNEIK
ncbi:hypothetical protein BB561_004317 [Smittium simulii]|uniref:G-patch domain-containing protein n=1 Tax=Smittium simulii TaxID=133385 RepID=A0A2T9YH57_9FUNG|nr:hypothetical protein BB561_004317 [Smittium simulii]